MNDENYCRVMMTMEFFFEKQHISSNPNRQNSFDFLEKPKPEIFGQKQYDKFC